ncbi:hypothetical protein GCM10009801_19110 [Streptomyces albiaxialis]|uniref:Major facilitator superfamily (MFS) profile domain-containing protein n=1 Tax=Streptomyces albiaxialis TaxID=329523 RepID=A0ABN2VUT6_9ACTN
MGLAVLTTALVLIGLDVTVVTIALPTLATAVGASTSDLQWTTNAFTLPFAALLFPSSAWGNGGSKRLLLAGLGLFAAGSALALPADSAVELIGARALMGTGAGLAVPQALALAPGTVAPGEGNRASAVASTGFALGLPLGPLAGGWLLQAFGWQAVFAVNALVGACVLAGAALAVPAAAAEPVDAPVDLRGAVLALAGTSALAFGLTEAPALGWSHPLTLLALSTGALLLCALAARTRRRLAAADGWTRRRCSGFVWATAALSFVTLILLALLFVLPPYLQHVQGYDAWATGVRLLPMMAGLAAGAAVADRCAARFETRRTVGGGLLLCSFGLLWIGQLHGDSPYAAAAGALTAAGFALGLTLSTALRALTAALPPGGAPGGNALADACRQMGAALGIALLGGALNASYRGELRRDTPPDLTAEAAGAGRGIAEAVRTAATLPARQGEDLTALAHHAFVTGMATTARIGAGATAVMAVLLMVRMPSTPPGPA